MSGIENRWNLSRESNSLQMPTAVMNLGINMMAGQIFIVDMPN
jgi:hypothetical protein